MDANVIRIDFTQSRRAEPSLAGAESRRAPTVSEALAALKLATGQLADVMRTLAADVDGMVEVNDRMVAKSQALSARAEALRGIAEKFCADRRLRDCA